MARRLGRALLALVLTGCPALVPDRYVAGAAPDDGANAGAGQPGATNPPRAGSSGNASGGTGPRGAGAGGVDPGWPELDVSPGPVLWLDATTVDARDPGGQVDSWPDRSGMHGAAVAADAASGPELVLDAIAGKPVVRFDGLGTWLQVAPFEAPDDVDVFLVWQSDTVPTTDRISHILRHGTGATTAFQYTYGSTEPDYRASFIVTSMGTFAVSNFGSSLGPALWNATFDSTAGDLTTRTGGLVTEIVDGQPRVGDASDPVLGIGARALPDRFWRGDIAELLIFDRVLAAEERSRVEQYLATRWVLAVP